MKLQTIAINVPYVLPLQDLTRADVNRVGAKAANLSELARAGFPVPDGFALTTEAFDHFVQLNQLDESQAPEKVLTAEMPPEVEQALRSVSREFDGSLLAVRSSGVAEDLAGASFAGQYETILGVHGYEGLVDAVRQCWTSAFSARVAAYKHNKGQGTNASMAVLVQQLVVADAAGVAFTANPVNGWRDETVVSAVRGLASGSSPARRVAGQPRSWRAIFWANLPIVMAALLFGCWAISEARPQRSKRLLDWPEMRFLFRSRTFACANGTILFSNLAMYVVLLAMPMLMSTQSGWSSFQTGLMLAVMSVTIAVFSPAGACLRLQVWHCLHSACCHSRFRVT